MAEQGAGERERLEAPLDSLTRVRGVLGALASTEDGFPLAARLGGEHDREALAAAAATIARSSSAVLARLGRGELEVAILEASKLSLLVRRVSTGYLLVVAEPEANLGLIVAEMDRASRKLEHAAAGLLHA